MVPSLRADGPRIEEYQVGAREYLQFAQEALSGDDPRGLIDSFGHSKRALHVIVDNLLHAYGLWTHNKRIAFPEKLKLLDRSGILSLAILRNLNVERNVMEHEYSIPEPARVEEARDVVRLLIDASKPLVSFLPYECIVGWREDLSHGIVRLNPFAGTLTMYRFQAGTFSTACIEGVDVIIRCRNDDHGLIGSFQVDPAPVWQRTLKAKTIEDWLPLIAPLIELQTANERRNFVPWELDKEEVQFWVPVSLPKNSEEARKLLEISEVASLGRLRSVLGLPLIEGNQE
jgi:hypothetical protein